MLRRPLAILGLLLVVALITGGLLLSWKWKRDAELLRRVDAEVAAEVEAAVIAHLRHLPPKSPISQRYGAFVGLEGTGYARHQGFKMGPSLSLPRRVRFEKAKVQCPIRVGHSDFLKIETRMYPSQEWMEETPDASLVRQGSELKMVRPGVEGSTQLAIAVGHPRFAYDAGHMRRLRQQAEDVDQLFQAFVAGAAQHDPAAADAALPQPNQPLEREVLNGLLLRAFAHPDPAVGIHLTAELARRQRHRAIGIAPSTSNLLQDAIADSDQPIDLRRQLVDLLLHSRTVAHRSLYEQLAEMGPDAHFTIPTLAAFIGHRGERHWRAAAGAPTEAVELLGSWGPASAGAVPALTEALREHPNAWDFRPAIAKALGQIGPAAMPAVPALVEATTGNRAKLRQAARAALDQIRTLPPAQRLRQVQVVGDGADPVPFALDRRNQFAWLSSDGKSIEVVSGKNDSGGFFQIDLDSAIGRRVVSLDTENVVSARATAESLALLRLEKDTEDQRVVFERWSLAERRRLERRILRSLGPSKPKTKIRIANTVWNPALTLVAFSVKTEHPVPNKPNRVGISNDVFVFGLDPAHDIKITEVEHYMMEPVGFSADSKGLLLFGQYFEDSWQWGLGKLDLTTEAYEAVADSDLSRSTAPHLSPGGRYAVYAPTGTKDPTILVLSLKSTKVSRITPNVPADRITPPWRIAAAVSEQHEKLAVATKVTLDLYDLASGKLEARHSLLNEQGLHELAPLLVEAGPEQVIYAGLSTKLPYETQTLWVKTMPVRSER